MTTDREIRRFVANLSNDEGEGFRVLEMLFSNYQWIGAVFGRTDISVLFKQKTNKDITETELEELEDRLSGLEDYLVDVAIEYIKVVVSEYANQQEETNG